MGKRSKIIKAIKANPKEFMYRGVYGFQARAAIVTPEGVKMAMPWQGNYSHRDLVRGVLRELGYIPKKKARDRGRSSRYWRC